MSDTIFEGQTATLDDLMTDIRNRMKDLDPASNEYALMNDQLARLMETANKDCDRQIKAKASSKRFSVSPDTLASVGANLAGILLVLNYERLNVISSKAFGMIFKHKV